MGRIGAQPMIEDPTLQLTLQTMGRLSTPEEFEKLGDQVHGKIAMATLGSPTATSQ